MRRTNLLKTTSALLSAAMVLSVCGCSAKPSTDTVETSSEAVTELETEEETVSPSGNDVSDNDVSETEAESEAETEESELSSEEETEEETEDADETAEDETVKKTSGARETTKADAKETTKAQTTTATETTTVAETTTEAVTVQSVSAVVNGTHYVGETLTGADFTVTVTMSDGSTLTNPAGWGASPLTLSSTSNMLTVSYQGASTTVTVPASVPETTAYVAEVATTAAETEAISEEVQTWIDEPDYICADGDWSYEYAMALFEAQNDLRAEIGLDDLIWDDEMYEAAKLAAKACGDAGTIDHTISGQYLHYTVTYNSNGDSFDTTYSENLQRGACPTVLENLSWQAKLDLEAVKKSPGHYVLIQEANYKYTAIAAYRKDTSIYISYIFKDEDEIYWIDD